MSRPQMRLPDDIRIALNETGLPWSVESRKKHLRVTLAGEPVIVLPRKPGAGRVTDRQTKNSLAAIRRAARARHAAN